MVSRRDSVVVEVVAREPWEATFRNFGFSEPAARSYAKMTGVTIDEPDFPSDPVRGSTSLTDYVRLRREGETGDR